MRSMPDLMRRLAPNLLAGNGRGRQAPGWAELRLLMERWDEIAGSAYAELTSPQTVKFQGTERRDGTLIVAAPGALRLELQHDAAMIIERVNRLFGYGAIARLQLVPQVTDLPAEAPQPGPGIDPALVAGIENEQLRDALANLGRWMPGQNR